MSQLRKTISPLPGVSPRSPPGYTFNSYRSWDQARSLNCRSNKGVKPEPARESLPLPFPTKLCPTKLLTLTICSSILSHRLKEKQMEPAETQARRSLRERKFFS
jgi:hypothetical protein